MLSRFIDGTTVLNGDDITQRLDIHTAFSSHVLHKCMIHYSGRKMPRQVEERNLVCEWRIAVIHNLNFPNEIYLSKITINHVGHCPAANKKEERKACLQR